MFFWTFPWVQITFHLATLPLPAAKIPHIHHNQVQSAVVGFLPPSPSLPQAFPKPSPGLPFLFRWGERPGPVRFHPTDPGGAARLGAGGQGTAAARRGSEPSEPLRLHSPAPWWLLEEFLVDGLMMYYWISAGWMIGSVGRLPSVVTIIPWRWMCWLQLGESWKDAQPAQPSSIPCDILWYPIKSQHFRWQNHPSTA